MTDIAPLGFGIETSGLDRGKRAAQDFAAQVGKSADAVDRLRAADLAGLKAAKDAADATARHATAKLNLLKVTGDVSAAALKEAASLQAAAAAAAASARAKFELAKAGGNVEEALEGVTRSGSIAAGVMQGVAREASAMAATMGIGGMGGRIGAAGAMGAAQAAAARLTPQLVGLGTATRAVGIGVGALVVGYGALAATLSDNQDRWASYQQQLTNSLGSGSAAQSSLFDVVNIANEVGVSVDAALTSFNRFARARTEIGATNEELLIMTETVMKLGRASGVEQGAMQGAMMQLSQALASGRLNGDELRSIMENMQPLAKAIAEGLGVGIGQLRRMGAEGELTGEKVFKALLSQSGKANDEFAKMPRTVEQAKTRMANQFDELAAHLGRVTGASKVIQTIIGGLSMPVEALNKAFRAAATDGIAEAETNLKKLEDRVSKIKNQTKAPADEFNKQFNKDLTKERELEKQRAEAEARLAKQRDMLEGEKIILLARAMKLEAARIETEKLLALGGRGKGFEKGALEKLNNLGVQGFIDLQKEVGKTATAISDTESGLGEVNRQLENLKRNDPFEKLVYEVRDLEAAIASGTGGMVDMRLQAMETARATGKSVEQVLATMKQLEMLRAGRDIDGKTRGAAFQNELAQSLAGGGDRMSAEVAAEAAQWAFDKFGDTVDRNSDIVRRYSAALMEMKLALQAVGDASELTRLKTQLEELAGVIGVIQGGGGSYAERLSKHQSGIAAFQSERSGMLSSVPPVAAATGRAVSPGLVGDLLKGAFGGTVTSTTGGKHVAGSYHYKGQAVDFVPKGGMRGATKDQIRALMAANNISVIELLGPGDKDHSDHFHVAFGRGGAAGRATATGAAANLTGQVVAGRNSLFGAQEQERALRMVGGLENQRADNNERITALQTGNPEAVRLAELELKVMAALQDTAPDYREMVEDAIRDADATERKLKAEQQIFDLKAANDNQARRNSALATGDPAQVKALELQLRIEEIRRTAPAGQQARLIGEATREDSLRTAEAAARMTGEFENQKRQIEGQYEIIRLIGDEERIQVKLLETRNALFAAGIPLNSELASGLLQQAETLERMNIALDRQREKWDFIKSSGRQLFEDLGRAGGDFFGTLMRTGDAKWKTLMGAMEEAFYSALDRMVQQFVISPIINLLTQGLTSMLGGMFGGNNLMTNNGSTAPITWTALGGVFNNSEPTPFAGGGVFNVPTRFNGSRGLAGEGPGLYEGIFPLRRGPDGKLGVAAHGGGGGGSSTTVNVFDQRAAGSSEAVEIVERETGDGMRQIDVMVRDSVKGHMRKGSFDADQRSSYGVQRQVARR